MNSKSNFITDVIGEDISAAANSKEAVELSNLNYHVGIKPALVNINGELKEIPKTNCTYNSNSGTPFATVGDTYTVIQNHTMFEILDDIIELKNSKFTAANALNDGAYAFMTLEINEQEIVLPDNSDIIKFIIMASTLHDGKGSMKISFIPVRLICSNGMIGPDYNNQQIVRIRHTKNYEQRIKIATNILKKQHNFVKHMNQTVHNLNKIKVTDAQVYNLVASLIFTKEELELISLNNGILNNIEEISTYKMNTHYKITKSIYNGIGQDNYKGTGLRVYNGITTYLSNDKTYSNPQSKLNNILGGSGVNMVTKTINELNTLEV